MLAGLVSIPNPGLGAPTKDEIKADICVGYDRNHAAERFIFLADIIQGHKLESTTFSQWSKKEYRFFKNYLSRNKTKTFTTTATIITVGILTEGMGLFVVLPAMGMGKLKKGMNKEKRLAILKDEHAFLFRPINYKDITAALHQSKNNFNDRTKIKIAFALAVFANIEEAQHGVSSLAVKIENLKKASSGTENALKTVTKLGSKIKTKGNDKIYDSLKAVAKTNTSIRDYKTHLAHIRSIQEAMDTLVESANSFDVDDLVDESITLNDFQQRLNNLRNKLDYDEKKVEAAKKRLMTHQSAKLQEKLFKKEKARLENDITRLAQIKKNMKKYKIISEQIKKELKEEVDNFRNKKRVGPLLKLFMKSAQGWWTAVTNKAKVALIESMDIETVLGAQPMSMAISAAGGAVNLVGLKVEAKYYKKLVREWNVNDDLTTYDKRTAIVKVLRSNIENLRNAMFQVLDTHSNISHFIWHAKSEKEITKKVILRMRVDHFAAKQGYDILSNANNDIIKGLTNYWAGKEIRYKNNLIRAQQQFKQYCSGK
ncbi:MAG: hypothetical protein GY754_03800 [bacterium]|nr:hypothetical protein [bacterium]